MRLVDQIIDDHNQALESPHFLSRLFDVHLPRIALKLKFASSWAVLTVVKVIRKSSVAVYRNYFPDPFVAFNRTGPTTLFHIYDKYKMTGKEIRDLLDGCAARSDVPGFFGAEYHYLDVANRDAKHWNRVKDLMRTIPQGLLVGSFTRMKEQKGKIFYTHVIIWADEKSTIAKTLQRLNTFDTAGI